MASREVMKKMLSTEQMLMKNIAELEKQKYEAFIKIEEQKKEITRLTVLLQNSRAE
jgi:hypothetical protein